MSQETGEPQQKLELEGPTMAVSVKMAIDPNVYSLSSGWDGLPKLSLTITSHFTQPITIYTFETALDESHAWDRFGVLQNFTATDTSTQLRVWFSGRQLCRRYSTRRLLGHEHEHRFMTLLPEVPVTVSHYVHGLQGWYDGIGYETFIPRGRNLRQELWARYFEPGHTYRIGVAY